MPKRFQDSTDWPAYFSALVRCSHCEGAARLALGESRHTRLTCASCGFSQEGELREVDPDDGSVIVATAPAGPYRRVGGRPVKEHWPDERRSRYLPWLRKRCCGDRWLWALSKPHLDYLQRYVAADLRERPVDHKSGGLSWRLPGWLKDRKNRDEILATLERMRAELLG